MTQTEQHNRLVNPKKMIVWLLIVSSIMLFGALTSAYIVKRMESSWYAFELPVMFNWSTLVIILSSVVMHLGYLNAKKKNLTMMRTMLIGTLLSGVVFMVLQILSVYELYGYQNSIVFGGRNAYPSGSFLYVLAGVHFAHIILGLLALMLVFYKTSNQSNNKKLLNWYQMGATFWHFLGILWVYLYIFLIINHK